jgi:hypothetical protein
MIFLSVFTSSPIVLTFAVAFRLCAGKMLGKSRKFLTCVKQYEHVQFPSTGRLSLVIGLTLLYISRTTAGQVARMIMEYTMYRDPKTKPDIKLVRHAKAIVASGVDIATLQEKATSGVCDEVYAIFKRCGNSTGGTGDNCTVWNDILVDENCVPPLVTFQFIAEELVVPCRNTVIAKCKGGCTNTACANAKIISQCANTWSKYNKAKLELFQSQIQAALKTVC